LLLGVAEEGSQGRGEIGNGTSRVSAVADLLGEDRIALAWHDLVEGLRKDAQSAKKALHLPAAAFDGLRGQALGIALEVGKGRVRVGGQDRLLQATQEVGPAMSMLPEVVIRPRAPAVRGRVNNCSNIVEPPEAKGKRFD
jgi:hypothetical protein